LSGPVTPSAVDYFSLCSHLSCAPASGGQIEHSSILLLRVINKALEEETASEGTYHSCRFCPLDCYVRAQDDSLEISVWQDLGASGHPFDPKWRAQTAKYGSREWMEPHVLGSIV
jgi:hypothetical protein